MTIERFLGHAESAVSSEQANKIAPRHNVFELANEILLHHKEVIIHLFKIQGTTKEVFSGHQTLFLMRGWGGV